MSEKPHSSKSFPKKKQTTNYNQNINQYEVSMNLPGQPQLNSNDQQKQVKAHPLITLPELVQPSIKCIHVPVIQRTPKAGESNTTKPIRFRESATYTNYNISNSVNEPEIIIIEDSDSDSSDLTLNSVTPATDFPTDSSLTERRERTTEILNYGDREKNRITYGDHQYPNLVYLNEFQPSRPLIPSIYEENRQPIGPRYIQFNNPQYLIQPNNNFSSIGIPLIAGPLGISEQQSERDIIMEHNNNSDNERPIMNQSNNNSKVMSSLNSLQDHEISQISATSNKVKKPRKKYKKRTGIELARSFNPVLEQNDANQESSVFSCNFCSKQYKSKRSLGQHMKFHKQRI